jgi:glutamine amidotransferase
MCRLFGFRSVLNSQVHSSLVSAENALAVQSGQHPDGWGVAYYLHDTPHIVKSARSALDDSIFRHVSGVVSSQTVLAHIRKATNGDKTILNTHPFQYGPWVFAHNGHLVNFENIKGKLLEKIPSDLKRFILGTTDSEIIFFHILSKILSVTDNNLSGAISNALSDIQEIAGDFCHEDKPEAKDNYLTFILTNGKSMLAHQGGKDLYYSTHKNLCPERDTCASFSTSCENKVEKGAVNHLIFSSEPLQGQNIWLKMKPGDLIGVDASMNLWRN